MWNRIEEAFVTMLYIRRVAYVKLMSHDGVDLTVCVKKLFMKSLAVAPVEDAMAILPHCTPHDSQCESQAKCTKRPSEAMGGKQTLLQSDMSVGLVIETMGEYVLMRANRLHVVLGLESNKAEVILQALQRLDIGSMARCGYTRATNMFMSNRKSAP